jgi:Putative translation factor (SUA5)
VTGVDISADALALARENAARLHLDVEFREQGLEAVADGWDLVVSNPPTSTHSADCSRSSASSRRRRWSAPAFTPGSREARRLASSCSRSATARRTTSHATWKPPAIATWRSPATSRESSPRRGRRPVSDTAVEALRSGEPAILPTDTVYGLVASAEGAAPTERLYALKGRGAEQPSALMTADIETLLGASPSLPAAPRRSCGRCFPARIR